MSEPKPKNYEGGLSLDILAQDGVSELTKYAVESRYQTEWMTVSELASETDVPFGRVSDVIDTLVDMGMYADDGDEIAPNYRPNHGSSILRCFEEMDHVVDSGLRKESD